MELGKRWEIITLSSRGDVKIFSCIVHIVVDSFRDCEGLVGSRIVIFDI